MRVLCVFTFLLLSFATFSSEVDQFTNRNENLRDSRMQLNEFINNKIQRVLEARKNKECHLGSQEDKERLQERLINHFGFALNTEPLSSIHRDVNFDPIRRNPRYRSIKIEHGDSIFQDVGVRDAPLSGMGVACCARILNVSDQTNRTHLIGVDKLSHFFTHGKAYYKAYQDTDGSEEEKMNAAFEVGKKNEFGVWGMQTTGVASYGDYAANYDGFRFWQSLFGTENPMLRCNPETGKYEQARQFDWGNYVTDAWDEAVNCSDYISDRFKEKVEARIQQIRGRDGSPMSCPLYPDRCEELREHYGEYAKRILHPSCLLKGRVLEKLIRETQEVPGLPVLEVPGNVNTLNEERFGVDFLERPLIFERPTESIRTPVEGVEQ